MGQKGDEQREDYQIAEKNGNPGRAVPTVERNGGRNGGSDEKIESGPNNIDRGNW